MLNYLKRMLCRHEWVWSERRGKEVCYRCRQSRQVADSGQRPAPPASPVSATPPLRDAVIQGDPVEVRLAQDEVEIVLIGAEEAARPGFSFGALGDQSLNAARVRDVRRS